MHLQHLLSVAYLGLQGVMAQGTNGFVQLSIPTFPSNPPQTEAQARSVSEILHLNVH